MISLDQVLLLEQKVESAVSKITQLQAENDALRSRCSELTNALSSKSEQLSSFETDQNKIENGILKALDRLNSIENSVLKAAGQVTSSAPVQAQPVQAAHTAPVQSQTSVQTQQTPVQAFQPQTVQQTVQQPVQVQPVAQPVQNTQSVSEQKPVGNNQPSFFDLEQAPSSSEQPKDMPVSNDGGQFDIF